MDWQENAGVAQRARKMAMAMEMNCPVLVALQGEKAFEPQPMDEFVLTNSRTGKIITTYYPAGTLQGVDIG